MQKKKIVLLESSAFKEHKVPEVPSNRVAALSPATVDLLERFEPSSLFPLKRHILFLYRIEISCHSESPGKVYSLDYCSFERYILLSSSKKNNYPATMDLVERFKLLISIQLYYSP